MTKQKVQNFRFAGWDYDTNYRTLAEAAAALDRHRGRLEVLDSIPEGLPYMRESRPTAHGESVLRPRDVIIHVQSGNVNLGTVVGDITSNVSHLCRTQSPAWAGGRLGGGAGPS